MANMVAIEDKNPLSVLVKRIAWLVMFIFVLALPLVFNPLSQVNVVSFPKWAVIFGVSMIMLLLEAVYILLERKINIVSKRYLILFGFLIVALIASILFGSSAAGFRAKIALLQGRAGIWLGLFMIMGAALVLIRDKALSLITALIGSAFLVSWVQILGFFGILAKVFANNPAFAAKTFTPLGDQMSLLVFLVVTFVISLTIALRSEGAGKKVFMFVVSGVQLAAAIFALIQVLPDQAANPKLLPFSAGWSIAMDQMKVWMTALFGVGPDGFVNAFSLNRPAVLNQGEDWLIRYGASTNEWLMVFTTMGLVGLAALVLMVLNLIKDAWTTKIESDGAKAAVYGLFLVVIAMTFLPASLGMTFLLALLGMIVIAMKVEEDEVIEPESMLWPAISAGVIVALIGYLGFNGVKVVMAENKFAQSAQYITENKGSETYYAQIDAIKFNPYVVNYRIAYSNTCLALANNIATKEELTDEERTMITQLITQAIREAKAAVSLDETNAANWANLARVYRQLIGFAQGADQWAVSSYIQAIRLDRTNPQLRLDLGGLLYALGSYEEAVDQFKQAVSLKPDFANAYYNLAYAYFRMEMYPQSYAAMENVLNLIDVNTADHEKTLNELKEIQKMLPQEQQQATPSAEGRETELQTPEPTPEPQVENPVQLQDEYAPAVDEGVGFDDINEGGEQNSESGEEATTEGEQVPVEGGEQAPTEGEQPPAEEPPVE
jgi:tetratricopeptide (TPR) repeat protein